MINQVKTCSLIFIIIKVLKNYGWILQEKIFPTRQRFLRPLQKLYQNNNTPRLEKFAKGLHRQKASPQKSPTPMDSNN